MMQIQMQYPYVHMYLRLCQTLKQFQSRLFFLPIFAGSA